MSPQPTALVLHAPRKIAFVPLETAPLAAGQVRIRTLYSGISAGTELSQYRGTNPFMQRRWDEASRLFVQADAPSWPYPVRNLGYEEVGEIIEIVAERMTGRFTGWNSAVLTHTAENPPRGENIETQTDVFVLFEKKMLSQRRQGAKEELM